MQGFRIRSAECLVVLVTAAISVWIHPSRAETLSFESDGSCLVSAMNADDTRGRLLGSAQCYSHPAPPGLPGAACPIWIPGFTDTTASDLVGAFFSKVVEIPGAPISGSVLVAVDDFVEITCNGQPVGSKGSINDLAAAAAAQAQLTAFELTPFLTSGPNEIVFRAQNGPYWFSGAGCRPCGFAANPCGLYFGGSIEFVRATAVTSASWGSLKMRYR